MTGNVALDEALQPRQLVALKTLARGGTTADAAAAAGKSTRTVERWLARPGFKDALRDMQTAVLRSVAAQLAGLACRAVHTLESLLAGESTSDAVRLRAAIATLDAAAKWREALSMEQRLAALEDAVPTNTNLKH